MENRLAKINPAFKKEEFKRKAWISLAQDDVPMEVFDLDLEEITDEQYRVLFAEANYCTAWSGEIGHNRTETYTDFETYYEKIPYTAYESKYNSTTKRTEQVPVTKYRQEERQRQVTKTRIVTDWSAGNGEHSGHVSSVECVDNNSSFSKSRFLRDFRADQLSDYSAAALAGDPEMVITPELMQQAYHAQTPVIEGETFHSLPGDHSRNISYRMTEYDPTLAILIKAPEYKTGITYRGKSYQKRGFAFGGMTMSPSGIPNPISVEAEKAKLTSQTAAENKKRDSEVEPKVWEATKIFSLSGVTLLALSIIFSLFVKFLFPVIACFLGAVGLSVFSMIYTKKTRERIQKQTRDANTEASVACQNAIRNYEKKRKADLLQVLNKKLASLGMEPAKEEDLNV
ncbi:MAG: hypothetical protein IJY50_01865 [Clostridia bacterium]|nr:hypothetical protein [Clostridia bacterium]